GRRVRVTSSHSVFVWEDGDKRLKRGDEIRPGDYVLAPARLPFGDAASPSLDDRFTAVPDGRAAVARVRREARPGARWQRGTQSVPASRPSVASASAKSAPAALTSSLESLPADSGAEVFSSTATWDGGQRIPDLVFNLPRDQQRAYMERFRTRKHPGDDRLILRTTSKDVAGQLAYLVLAQDMQVRILQGADMSRGETLYWVIGEKGSDGAVGGADLPGGDLIALRVASVTEV